MQSTPPLAEKTLGQAAAHVSRTLPIIRTKEVQYKYMPLVRSAHAHYCGQRTAHYCGLCGPELEPKKLNRSTYLLGGRWPLVILSGPQLLQIISAALLLQRCDVNLLGVLLGEEDE